MFSTDISQVPTYFRKQCTYTGMNFPINENSYKFPDQMSSLKSYCKESIPLISVSL